MKNTFYPDLNHPVAELSAYSQILGIFFISLHSGAIIKFEPDNMDQFEQWLKKYRIRNINEQEV